jgi:hypothetical protein
MVRLYSIIFTIIFITGFQSLSQNLPWNAFLGNEGAEFAYDIKQTTDHGYIIAAYANNGGSSDFYVVKLNTWGGLEWEKNISKDNYSDRAFSVEESQEGDFIIIGNATNFNKPWLVKLNPLGDTLWTSQWTDSVANNTGLLARGTQLPDGRIVVVSHEDAYALDPYMFIVSQDGELLEERDLTSLVPLGWYSGTVINDIETTNDGGFILTGATGGGTGSRAYLWKFDANADSSWSKIYDASGAWMRSAQSVKQLSDGGYILTGFTAPNATTTAALRADVQGNLLWFKSYPDSIYTNGTDVIEWKSGEFLITEKRFSGFGTSFFKSAMLRIDSLGNLLVRDPIMASDSSTTITQMRQTSDGGFVIAGEINEYLSVGQQDLFVLKSDSLGNIDDVSIDYVWPGDVNYDGEVTMDDLMILGITAGATGPARVDNSIDWYAHYVTDWADTVVTGVNFKHADTDGNGIVEIADTAAISLNYGKIHSIGSKSSWALNGPALFVIPEEAVFDGYQNISIPVYLGTENIPLQNLYGIRFSIAFDDEILNGDHSVLDISGNWIGQENEALHISKVNFFSGTLDFGMTRINHQEVSGYGFFGILHLKINDNYVNTWEELTFSLNFLNIQAHQYNLEIIPVTSEEQEITVLNTTTDIQKISEDRMHIYPNPIENGIIQMGPGNRIKEVNLLSAQGKRIIMLQKEQNGAFQIPEGSKPGLYFLRITLIDNSIMIKKIIIR